MEAYNVKRGTKVLITDDEMVKIPPSSLPVNKGDVVTIESLDGMYCNCINEKGKIVYIAAWTQVQPLT